jgi:nucleotide-binding universal stress UspA family protein
MKPRILVPFDFSPSADAALAWALELRRTADAGPIQMVHAINSQPLGTAELPLDRLLPNQDEITALRSRMTEAASRHGGGAVARVIVQPSPVGDIILDAAREGGADLIVMGTHGRTGIKRMFLGSVAEHVLRHAGCPVVTIHAYDAKLGAAGRDLMT